jgi:hypothetical protein
MALCVALHCVALCICHLATRALARGTELPDAASPSTKDTPLEQITLVDPKTAANELDSFLGKEEVCALLGRNSYVAQAK